MEGNVKKEERITVFGQEQIKHKNSSRGRLLKQVWENLLLARYLPQNGNSRYVKREEAWKKELEDEESGINKEKFKMFTFTGFSNS